ncbi:MAG: hypothetical protein L0H55_16470 [Candidatus Nitrosocosmicus sp.]|nr:hypothetical protein [Candidatus Nitrosocosmicus sp.]
MNKIYLFAIASILATASLMAGTFTSAAIAQDPIPPDSEMGSTTDPMSSNMTATDGNVTGTDNSTAAPM